MNWWIVAYIVFYSGLLLYSLWYDLTTLEPVWYIVLGVISGVAVIAFTVAYWSISTPLTYGALWTVLFAFSVGWLILTASHVFKKEDIEWANSEDRPAFLLGIFFTLVYSGPGYFWGAMLSWRYLKSVVSGSS